jgi:hypothetical protein
MCFIPLILSENRCDEWRTIGIIFELTDKEISFSTEKSGKHHGYKTYYAEQS